jgi:endonuclease-3
MPRTGGRKPPKESQEQRKSRAKSILRILKEEFPGATTALLHQNPFQLLIATILSAQCTDERVNQVTPGLFQKYPDARTLASANQQELEEEIRSTGFYHNKARSILACSRALNERFAGRVPRTMEELLELPGVGRKTANVVLGGAYGIPSGVVVDTHVHRLAERMGLAGAGRPDEVESDLMSVFEKKDWIDVGSILILHGRRTCRARKPNCPACSVRKLCPSADTF